MSTFAVNVLKIDFIENHPNADRLDIASIGGYRSIVGRDQYKKGDTIAYIPESSILPPTLIEEMKLSGYLAGPDKNRVKAVRLRGTLSQGLCYPARSHWTIGQDVTEELGITKYIPLIPAHMSGSLWFPENYRLIRYDIENWKRYPDVLKEGEEVVFTEKIHGTFCLIGVLPKELADDAEGDVIVSSKGNAAAGRAFKMSPDQNAGNVYVRTARILDIPGRIRRQFEYELSFGIPVFVMGEVFGRGVQDLKYGFDAGRDESIGFRVFDIHIGQQGKGTFLCPEAMRETCKVMGLESVPLLYEGQFSQDVMMEHTAGSEMVSGRTLNIREGIVMRPKYDRWDVNSGLGRVILKSVSADYLTRHGETTELE